ncbi:hypothetical protein [Pantoea sp. A4]|uniref:hypothetical protein n=1 Tax=Pantoea sp. A4 TaxID=1225184 RepID=UPI00037E385F|nr:hypothetical protein [Pantoea sp. A4]
MLVIFDNENICVKFFPGSGKKDEIKITFNSHLPKARLAIIDTNPLKGGWEAELTKANMPSLFVIEKNNSWFNFPEIHDVLERINGITREFKKRIVIGASLGGHASLKFSSSLNPDLTISISPQYCVNTDIVPFENRWREDIAAINEIQGSNIADENIKGLTYVIVDNNHIIDNSHVKLIKEKAPSTNIIQLPDSGHSSARALFDLGLLEKILLGDFDSIPNVIEKLEDDYNKSKLLSPTVIKIIAEKLDTQDRAKWIREKLPQLEGHPRHLEQLNDYLSKLEQ